MHTRAMLAAAAPASGDATELGAALNLLLMNASESATSLASLESHAKDSGRRTSECRSASVSRSGVRRRAQRRGAGSGGAQRRGAGPRVAKRRGADENPRPKALCGGANRWTAEEDAQLALAVSENRRAPDKRSKNGILWADIARRADEEYPLLKRHLATSRNSKTLSKRWCQYLCPDDQLNKGRKWR